jgi:tetratricopeptide (TPR) repeat protein
MKKLFIMRIPFAVIGSLIVLLIIIMLNFFNIGSKFISGIMLEFPGIDKPIHFFEYFFAALTVYYLLSFLHLNLSNVMKIFIAVFSALTISLLDEFHQIHIAERSFEYADIASNVCGIISAYIVIQAKKIRTIYVYAILGVLVSVVLVLSHDSYNKLKHYVQGMKYEKRKEYLKAKEEYLLALQAGNDSASLYNNIAWVEIEFLNGDPEVVYEFAYKAYVREPDNADILDTYGWVLFKMNKPAEAVKYLEKALSKAPDIFCIHYHLGASYLALGEYELSLRHLKKQIARNPTNRYGLKSKEIIEKIEKDRLLSEFGLSRQIQFFVQQLYFNNMFTS